jgi:8-oxo-dGTP pyrophosphatase MutT (NUDIX family)
VPAADTPTPATPRANTGRKRSRHKPRGAGSKQSGSKQSGSKKPGAQRGPKIPTTKEVSAGGVVYRRADDGIEVVLASRRTRRGQLAWGLAKGGIEIGETREQAAIREVREETGLTADIEVDLGDTKYMYVWDDIRIRKTVHFFLMRHTGGNVDERDDEMEEIRWFPMDRAIKRAAYRGERDMLVKASELLR